jgi:tRNA1(Val) A37 N6-methylase TrmN6
VHARITEIGIATPVHNDSESLVSEVRLFAFCELLIATDHLWYAEPSPTEGMVMPLHPENSFLAQVIPNTHGARVLDIGFGSGVLGLLALARGGASVTGVDVSRRCQRFAKFNTLLNRLELNRCAWLLSDVVSSQEIFRPVQGQQFDLIVCNPPFEVGRDEAHTALTPAHGGSDGLVYFRHILPRVASYLTEHGEAHFVFFSVGNHDRPQGILEIAEQSEGNLELSWLPNSVDTAEFHLWNTGKVRGFTEEQSRLWMGRIVVRRSSRREIKTTCLPAFSEWANWHFPIYGTTPIGYNPHKERWTWG